MSSESTLTPPDGAGPIEPAAHHLGRAVYKATAIVTVPLFVGLALLLTGKISLAAFLIAMLLLVGLSPMLFIYADVLVAGAPRTPPRERLPAGDRTRMGRDLTVMTDATVMFALAGFATVGLHYAFPGVLTNVVFGGALLAELAVWAVVFVRAQLLCHRDWLAEVLTLPGSIPSAAWPRSFGDIPGGEAEQRFRCGLVTPAGSTIWFPHYAVGIWPSGMSIASQGSYRGGPLDAWFIPWTDVEGAERNSYVVPGRGANSIPCLRIVLRNPRVPIILWGISYKTADALKRHGVRIYE